VNLRLTYVVPVLLFVIVGVFLAVGLRLNPGYIESPLLGKTAPGFSLPALENPRVMVGTGDMAGQYALLNVWATWCVECRHEHEFLLQLADSGMPIYGLNWKDVRGDALEWLDTLGNPYVASAEDANGRVGIDYGVYGAPETFLLAPDLTILHKHLGPLNGRIWEQDFLAAMERHRNGG
jgi:cytochrome c biogenesis protein CcmG/thiol:disulfide interchange protein DsbE